MPIYRVLVPIVGYATSLVVADTEEDAKKIALSETRVENIESWEAVEEVSSKNWFMLIKVEEQ